jgi:aryl carrier-like protein
MVALPKAGYCSERLVAVVSLAIEAGNDEPLALFNEQQKPLINKDIEAIRERVSQRLPPYMIPSVWIAVGALPKLPSGKLDRKRVSQWLAAMSVEDYRQAIPTTESETTAEAPTDDVEIKLRAVWAHVLNLPEEKISLDRSFLSLGGDSISAMQVMGQCRKKGLGLGVQEILRSKSLVQLASAVQTVQTTSVDLSEETDIPFNLSPIQALWYQLPNQGHGHFNQSFYLRIQRRVTGEELRLAVEKLVSRHSMLRARFTFSNDAGWQQRVTDNVADSYRFRHRAGISKAEIDTLIEDSQKCLNPSTGPLFAADLFDLGEEQHAFLVGHHLVIDLVSWRVLLEELEEILIGGDLLPLAVPFQRWSQVQQDHAKTLKFDRVLPAVNIPPMDFSYWGIQPIDNTYGNAGHLSFELDPTTTATFLSECHNAMTTEPVEVLLASLLHSWPSIFNDRAVPAIFNEGHGREPWNTDIDISRTVGWFTTRRSAYCHSPTLINFL